ncbi:cytochrome c biogenesis protein [Myxococcota bacterium]|nr:cytochrome c biogenesis protein [Myxococcota bacterium]
MTTQAEELFGPSQQLTKTPPLLIALTVVAAVMIVAAVWMTFFYAPVERVMGFIQKIFYFHVPAAWNMMMSVVIMAVASVGYLVKKTDAWDRVSDAAVELAMIFGIMVLLSGPLWGRKAWGVYWVWDVRLTSTLILVLTLVAVKIVREYAGPNAKQIAAGLAVFAVLDTVFVYFCVKFWRTTHPPQVTGSLDPAMKQTLYFCALTFVVVYVCMLWARLRMGKLRTGLDRLHMQATEAGFDD